MAEATSEALSQNTSILEPGQSGNFAYLGELIPNQVDITNRNDEVDAPYTVESGRAGWKFFGNTPAAETTSILVQWFDGVATFQNLSEVADIEISGDGIFPQGQEPA